MKQKRSEEISDIPGLAKYLPLDEEEADDQRTKGKSDSKGDTDTEETKKEVPVPEVFEVNTFIEPYTVSIINQDQTGMGGTGRVIRSGKRRLKSRAPAPGSGKGKPRALTENEISVKMFSNSFAFSEQEYTAVINGDFEGRCDIRIRAIGDEGSEKIRIKDVQDPRGHKYHIHNNCIHGFYMDDKSPIQIKIKLEDKMKLSLKAEAYEV